MKRQTVFYHFVWLLTLLMIVPSAQAKVNLPAIIGDHMVLQQQSEVTLWGWAEPNETIVIKAQWAPKSITTTADAKGNWHVTLTTPKAGGTYQIQINDRVVKDVLIGEVWLASGQSNMQMALQDVKNGKQETRQAHFPQIRIFTVKRQYSDQPQKDCEGHWQVCSPQTIGGFSAVAYYFGKELHQKLQVPVGLIHSSWGGTRIQAWMKREVLADNPKFANVIKIFEEKKKSAAGTPVRTQNSPASLYNAMIHPLIPFYIKGAIWYQGEANVRENSLNYHDLLEAMITNWRNDWGIGDFSFYFVQLAPFAYENPVAGAVLRDAQRKALRVKNTGMAVTLDVGNPDDIHPKDKETVGKRLALWALAKDYGWKNLVYSGPLYRSFKIEGERIRLFFDHVGSGLMAKNGRLTLFEIAGANKLFLPAQAKIENNTVVVWNSKIKNPLAVRYAFHNADSASLFNKEGLPASTFRTDDWPIVTDEVVAIVTLKPKEKGWLVKLATVRPGLTIRYTLNGQEPDLRSTLYEKPFFISQRCQLKARAFQDGIPSFAVSTYLLFKHKALGANVTTKFPPSPRYPGTGPFTLVDGVFAGKSFLDKQWQGYEFDDLVATFTLDEAQSIHKISLNFLQAISYWIFLPRWIEVQISKDGQHFTSVGRIKNSIPLTKKKSFVQTFELEFPEQTVKAIKVHAKNTGTCPAWHPGAGGKAWIFVDEIFAE